VITSIDGPTLTEEAHGALRNQGAIGMAKKAAKKKVAKKAVKKVAKKKSCCKKK